MHCVKHIVWMSVKYVLLHTVPKQAATYIEDEKEPIVSGLLLF